MDKRADRDPALLLDRLLAARDARGFAAGMDEAGVPGQSVAPECGDTRAGSDRRGGGQRLASAPSSAAGYSLA
jgi:hypothetical protein